MKKKHVRQCICISNKELFHTCKSMRYNCISLSKWGKKLAVAPSCHMRWRLCNYVNDDLNRASSCIRLLMHNQSVHRSVVSTSVKHQNKRHSSHWHFVYGIQIGCRNNSMLRHPWNPFNRAINQPSSPIRNQAQTPWNQPKFHFMSHLGYNTHQYLLQVITKYIPVFCAPALDKADTDRAHSRQLIYCLESLIYRVPQ